MLFWNHQLVCLFYCIFGSLAFFLFRLTKIEEFFRALEDERPVGGGFRQDSFKETMVLDFD